MNGGGGRVNVARRIEWKMGGRGLDKFKNKGGMKEKIKKQNDRIL